ncbi:hypothetical protein BDR03DRAFT_987260 [Suillus americanus]|nr:hypothetical protein BDR03DRAFT_987260 [Suillus americanus]
MNSVSKVLKHQELVQRAASMNERQQIRLQVLMSIEPWKDDKHIDNMWQDESKEMGFGDVLDGTEPLPISHAGGDFWNMNQAFAVYLAWSLEKSEAGFKSFYDRLQSEDSYLESAENVTLNILSADRTIASALVCQGIVPCSPISPTVGIMMEVLELYRVVHLRSPHLSIQSFVKSVCNLHGVEFCRHLSCQFLIVFNVVWLLWYELADEEQLTFSTLYVMDGNDSLKRVLRRSLDPDGDESLRPSSELPTGQQLTSDRYLSCTFVDQFARDSAHTITAVDEDIPAENSCARQWKNMDDTKTKKAWGIYNETDMVQISELAKYPLAVVSKLMGVFGKNLGGGYDIGCQFKTTLDKSSLGPLAHSLQHTCLVGGFHGHAHHCLCQLVFLTTYIMGLGLENLETCKRTFSKSNSLASSLCYASIFHFQQAIDSYFEHNDDLEVYANICKSYYEM